MSPLYPDPFGDGMIDAEPPWPPDGYGLRPMDEAYWQDMDAAVATAAADEPHVHDAESVEECSLCGPLLREAVLADFRDALDEAA